jgi:cell division protein FtsA
VVLTGGSSQLPGIRKVASGVLSLPCRVAAPQNLHGLVDKLTGPAYSTSVGLLHWAQRESYAPPTRKKKKSARTIDLNKGLDFFKRLLP